MDKDDSKSWCVYMHTNNTNGKVYVDITSNLYRRWRNNGAEYMGKPSPFSSALKKYGWDGFTHEIIADNISLNDANLLEMKLIAKYKSNRNRYGTDYGYNQTDGGDGTKGFPQYGENNPFWNKHHTESTKQKISRAKLGQKSSRCGVSLTNEQKERVSLGLKKWYLQNESSSCKEVICISDNRHFRSVKEAAKYYNINNREISAVCLGRRKTTHGLKFTYHMDGTEPEYTYVGKGYSEHTENLRKIKSIPVECIDTGVIYESAKVAAHEVGIKSRSCVCQCCKGRAKTAGGLHWRYAEVNQYE